jgi:hypothetical protein
MRATAHFDVTRWDATVTDTPDEGPALSRVAIHKAFQGDLTGESVGEGLFCGMERPADGAGYVVSERFAGRLGDRQGTFVIQHGGLAGPAMEPQSFGSVVPGSGTGGLAGLSGTVTFGEGHTLTLDYDLA